MPANSVVKILHKAQWLSASLYLQGNYWMCQYPKIIRSHIDRRFGHSKKAVCKHVSNYMITWIQETLHFPRNTDLKLTYYDAKDLIPPKCTPYTNYRLDYCTGTVFLDPFRYNCHGDNMIMELSHPESLNIYILMHFAILAARMIVSATKQTFQKLRKTVLVLAGALYILEFIQSGFESVSQRTM